MIGVENHPRAIPRRAVELEEWEPVSAPGVPLNDILGKCSRAPWESTNTGSISVSSGSHTIWKVRFMADQEAGCLVCQRPSEEVPLISFKYQGADLWICPQHLPTLIHDPAKLSGLLPGAENMVAADHSD